MGTEPFGLSGLAVDPLGQQVVHHQYLRLVVRLGPKHGYCIVTDDLDCKSSRIPRYRKTYISSAKMRVLKPKIDEINKKYPKQEDAMKKTAGGHGNVQPIRCESDGWLSADAGTVQVLIALFMFVPSAIELRQQSFLWADDLSTYDAFINFPFNIPFWVATSVYSVC